MSPERTPDLFDAAVEAELAARAPLAARLRPKNLDEVVGQRHLLGPKAAFRRLVEADRLSSAVFYGPPGTGKTTVARLVAEVSKKSFVQLSATSAGVKDVREVLDQARHLLGQQGRQTILFLDEIHRFSKSQQDALLPAVEDGTIVLIGATTENPFFSLTAPLLSRSTLFRFESLAHDELLSLVSRAAVVEDVEVQNDAATACVDLADGDARAVLTTLEVAIAIARANSAGKDSAGKDSAGKDGPASQLIVGNAEIEGARSTRALRFGQDEHYDIVSALIKSIRGSDPDAGIYWLARLLASGEDPRFLARRLVILASEDVGIADPQGLVVANAAAGAVDRVGLPEAGLNLAEAVIYLALAPKSNRAAAALWRAQDDVANKPSYGVPVALRDAHYRGAGTLGHGAGYEYPHDDPSGWVDAVYLPSELAGQRYYEPSDHGLEPELARAWDARRAKTDHELTSEEDEHGGT